MKRNNDIEKRLLIEQIERYFDGVMTDAEEERLRHRVAETNLRHPAIDEARALMGFRRPARRGAGRRKAIRLTVGVAASIAVAVLVGINFPRTSVNAVDGTTCIAYVNGERITDEEAVLDILGDNLAQFDDASLEMNEAYIQDIDSVAPVIEDYQTQLPLSDN